MIHKDPSDNQNRRVLYISGSGRSGSTLLDIILGSQQNHTSLGELIFFYQKGIINNEYCSCGNRLQSCKFWSKVIKSWKQRSDAEFENYIRLQKKFLGTRNTIRLIWNYWFPSKDFNSLVRSTQALYEVLFDQTENSILIDSSKTPGNILLLRKTNIHLTVIHLVRKFSSFLKTSQKKLDKNVEMGIENERKALSITYALFTWIVNNLLTCLFSTRKSRRRIRFEHLTEAPFESISVLKTYDPEFKQQVIARGPFQPSHLVAGNRLRMKKEIYIKKLNDQDESDPLSRFHVFLSNITDRIFH